MRYSGTYIGKIIFIVLGAIIAVASLLYSNYIAGELASKEKREISMWSHALKAQNMDLRNQIIIQLADNSTEIPAIVIDEYMRVVSTQNVAPKEIDTPEKLRTRLEKMASGGRSTIAIQINNGRNLTIFYDDSALLRSLYWFPYLQLLIIGVFIIFAMITFRSTKASEQNKVWIGMSKETAHQLGTPTSSLLGWIEYLKSQPAVPEEVVVEMSKDVSRLMKVVDRFSKIGSTTQLSPSNVYDICSSVVSYFSTRIPRNVTLTLNGQSDKPLQAMINSALMEWVLENLLKNALDALGGRGAIEMEVQSNQKYVIIDVRDSGKGIAKSNWHRIFSPGFTTKTRGWGLGLSLSRRIVERYHHGRIFVAASEIDKGTTIRVELKRL